MPKSWGTGRPTGACTEGTRGSHFYMKGEEYMKGDEFTK